MLTSSLRGVSTRIVGRKGVGFLQWRCEVKVDEGRASHKVSQQLGTFLDFGHGRYGTEQGTNLLRKGIFPVLAKLQSYASVLSASRLDEYIGGVV